MAAVRIPALRSGPSGSGARRERLARRIREDSTQGRRLLRVDSVGSYPPPKSGDRGDPAARRASLTGRWRQPRRIHTLTAGILATAVSAGCDLVSGSPPI